MMQLSATNTSAAITGLYTGVLALAIGPRVDAGGNLWLLIATAAFAGPAYFFVFGVRQADMVGFWLLKPALLKRIALCFAGIICVGAVAQVFFVVWSTGTQ